MNQFIQPLKKTFSSILDSTLKKLRRDSNHYILYKIVDAYTEKDVEYYKLQCSYTKAIFHLTIHEIVFDLDILYALHPIQGCFIGIEYAKAIKATTHNPLSQEKQHKKFYTYSMCRYGSYSLLYKDRKGFVGFECKDNGQQMLMDPRDISLSRELIEEFDAAQAFYIGLWAGLKFASPIPHVQEHHKKRKAGHLQLVKG